MKPHITPDDSIYIKKGFFFNYYKRLRKTKITQKGEELTIHLNRTRQITLMPSVQRMSIPVCLFGIFTNGCLFDYSKLSSGDKLKLDHFYPELERWLISFKELKKSRIKKKIVEKRKTASPKKKKKKKKTR